MLCPGQPAPLTPCSGVCPGLYHLSESRGWTCSCYSAPCMETTSYWTEMQREGAYKVEKPSRNSQKGLNQLLWLFGLLKALTLPGALPSKMEGKGTCLKEYSTPQVPRGFYSIFNSFFPSFFVLSTLPSFHKHLWASTVCCALSLVTEGLKDKQDTRAPGWLSG